MTTAKLNSRPQVAHEHVVPGVSRVPVVGQDGSNWLFEKCHVTETSGGRRRPDGIVLGFVEAGRVGENAPRDLGPEHVAFGVALELSEEFDRDGGRGHLAGIARGVDCVRRRFAPSITRTCCSSIAASLRACRPTTTSSPPK